MASNDGANYAGFWIRTGATLIDEVLLLVVILAVVLPIYGPEKYLATEYQKHLERRRSQNTSVSCTSTTFASMRSHSVSPLMIHGPTDFVMSRVFPVVAIILFWRYKSATPGKMLLSLKIVDAQTGGPLSLCQCVGRYFAYLVSALPLGLGYLWIACDDRKQAWHDKLAGTVVIHCQPEENRRYCSNSPSTAAVPYRVNDPIATLAAAYAENGDFEKAKQWQAKAIELLTDETEKEIYRSRLRLYEQGKPC